MTKDKSDFILKTVKEKPTNLPVSDTTGETKKGKFPVLLLILLLLFLGFCVFGVYMRLRDPNITLWKLLKLQNLAILPKKSVIQTRPPKLLTDQKVTQKIPATGGSAKITTPTGYTYTVSIGPGVLAEDSTLTLTPLEEEPYDMPSSDEPPPDPGIDITVDPPLPPPEPPDEPPIDPDDPLNPSTGSGPPRPPPIDVEVTFIPSEPEPGTVVPDTSQDPNELARQIMESAGLGNLTLPVLISPSVTPRLATTRNRDGSGKTPTFFVFVPRQGSPRIIPIGPPMGGPPPDTEPPDSTEPPEGGNGDVPGEGTITPEDPKDKGKADDAANQAGANGHCTDEYIFAYTQAYSNAQDDGDTAGMKSYGAALKDCAKDKLSWLKRLCQTDRRLLRRLDFTQYKQSLSIAPDSDDLMIEAIKLENTCKGYYALTGSASPAGSGTANVFMTSTIDSHVCGYFDDQWQGTNTYNLTAEGGKGVHDYEGKHSFRLPARGGSFFAIDTPVAQGLTIIGRSVDITLPNLGFYGTFDGLFTVDLMLYPMANLKAEIPLVSTDCTETPVDMPAIPLAPVPPIDIPLVPLVPQR